MLLAYGAGFGRAIEVIFANWGTRIIGVFPGRTSQQAGGQKAGTQIKFTIDDLDRITAAAPLVNRITPEVEQDVTVQRDVRTYTLPIKGVYPSMFKILALKLAEGRLLNEDDEASRARVAVISSDAKLKLFSGEYAIGQHIRIDGISYTGDRRAHAAHAGGRRQRQQDHLHPLQHHERLQGHALS